MQLQIRRPPSYGRSAPSPSTFVIASAVPVGSGQEETTAAATPSSTPQQVCARRTAPVCATKGNIKFTYANSC